MEGATSPPLNSELYEGAYRARGPDAERYGRWRALGAVAKADHVASLAGEAGVEPRTLLEVGCGDGALLAELARRGFVRAPDGLEISRSAVAIARERPELGAVEAFDGLRVPADDGHYDLGILSHVLEHVADPRALLAEVARACRAVVVEVPLEANVSARRESKRDTADAVGHVQNFTRASARALATGQGLAVAAELVDPLSREVHTFFARGTTQRLKAMAKWALRRGLFGVAPRAAERAFTVHYAYLCRRPR